jgi:integrase
MAGKWEKENLPHVESYVDETRPKYGRKFDRYYRSRFRVGGILYRVCFGWMSAGWTPRKCYDKTCEYKENIKTGQRPTSWAEEQEMLSEQAKLDKAAREADLLKTISLKQFFDDYYLPNSEANKKPESVRKEREHVANWIDPVTGQMPMKELTLTHVKKIRDKLSKAKKSPRTQQYVMRTFTTIWNHALDEGIVTTPCPTKNKSFKLPKVDNEKKRYLTPQESEKLLDTLLEKNNQVYNMALASLEAGLRFGEVANLTWDRVDLDNKLLHVFHTKSGKDRTIPMSERLANCLSGLAQEKTNSKLVFPNRHGNIHSQVPTIFKKGIEDSNINEGITDPKLKASFHTLRHTFASRLVQAGVDLHTVKVLLGHSTPVVTQRYSHLRQDDLKQALNKAERQNKIDQSKGKVLDIQKARTQE